MILIIIDRMGEEAHFYSNAEVYWRDVPPTVDGMLGGYGSISNVDLNGSKAFLKKFTGVRNASVKSDTNSLSYKSNIL